MDDIYLSNYMLELKSLSNLRQQLIDIYYLSDEMLPIPEDIENALSNIYNRIEKICDRNNIDYSADFEANLHNLTEPTIRQVFYYLGRFNVVNVFYVGYSDPNLVKALKESYNLVLGDWYDITNKSYNFWLEEDEKPGDVPSWAEDVQVQIEGIPPYDLLIYDSKDIDWDFYEIGLPKVILFLENEITNPFKEFRYIGDYRWEYKNGVYLGLPI